ncbi:N-succinylarginine dihydrolase [Sphingomonas sp. MAH-20]|uniref:N-succinylarginine dihydrolase n=1 Tax=Sphingomonas horti TaxID=2682842 RepID=A0A6I4J536_9SPHN|nr:N-succinylarginine dihydrolase [Sphingomonas sp. CGMCC 1.13658]MBA2921215.1 N-succinylarginine dihydrolase [Sphingomonas sp. CGMCC 1.13658]MVO79456.1 N-succinylarginine dihydrolase [Sphingomonas horti]
MSLTEINFDGIVGPSHNYAGLSLGNLASAKNANQVSYPRAAALQGLAKMRHNVRLGLPQGLLLPHRRPDTDWLGQLGATMNSAAPVPAWAMSASAMWTANAATISPAPDTKDGKCHLTVANLVTMPHRSHEWPQTLKQLRLAFAHPAFVVHGPVPAPFGDEGAANHMRLAPSHGEPGVEIFVYGRTGGPFPARQHRIACEAVATHHGLDRARTLFVEQAEEAIAAGAFHNDVVAVADGLTLFAHEQAFVDRAAFYADLERLLPEIRIVEVPAARVSLGDAIASYLFNAQLVTLPSGEQALILPSEAQSVPSVAAYLDDLVAGNGPIRRVLFVDVRQSMANGGGPACLRLRVVADPATIDPRFMLGEEKLDWLEAFIGAYWPESISPSRLCDPALHERIWGARKALLKALGLAGEDL